MEVSEKVQRTRPNAALITPSASPPQSRPRSPQPRRIPDQPSPTKRPRLSSAPRQIQQRASSSSSTSVDPFDFHRAREESAMRLFDVWAGLAERYSRPLDEDDIIDITTGKVVKDRGVLRGSQNCIVGAFADPTPEDAEDDLEEDEEDDIDELDSLTNPAMGGVDAPPLIDLDARDAQDLREFLEAEQRRREIYGSEADETEGSIYESQPEEIPAVEESDRDMSQECSERGQTSDRPHESIYVDSGSEDELGGWDLKEASTVYRLPTEEDFDSEVEVLDRTTQPTQLSPEVPLPPWTSPKTRPRRVSHQRQLQTPPQSQSDPSATPDDFSNHLPPSSPPRSSSPFSHYDSSPIKSRPVARGSKKPVSEGKRTTPSQAQPKHPSRPIPRLDLTKVSAEPSVKSKHVLQTPSTSSRTHSTDSGSTNTREQSKTTSVQSTNRMKGKLKQPASEVHVVIRQRTPSRAPSQRRNYSPKEDETKRNPHSTAKAKGKQKAPSNDERVESFEEGLPQRSSSPLASKLGSSRSRSRRPSVSSIPSALRVAEPLISDVGSSTRKPKPILLATQPGPRSGKKRKRIVSVVETVEGTPRYSPEPSTEDIRRNSSTSRSRSQSSDASHRHELSKESSSRRKDRHKYHPQRRSYSAKSESDDASQENEVEQGQPHSSRAPSHFNAPYYPYPPPSYPPHHRPNQQQQQQPIYTPLQDPRAQYIFTQAMQQIFALGSGAWAPPPPGRGSTPFTPKHHHRHRGDPPPAPSMYSTPMHHPHPYPYSYDPMLSNATLPPSSPEVPSSSPGTSASGGQRRKSLVKRSQSRGRRVSFREEESDIDALGGPDADSDAGSPSRRHASGSESKERKKKGKSKARDEILMSDSEGEPVATLKPIPKRGRPATRHQTPGPSSHEQDPAREARRGPSTHQSRSKSRV